MENNTMIKRIALLASRLLIGCVFVFSGFVKAVDPLGYTYKIQDYLTAMGPFFDHFAPLAFSVGIILSAIEFIVGLNLIFGIRLKETTWLAALLMLFMTPLTLWIAIKNPVHDCGCFGDALVISNWATFGKNIVISLLIISIYLLRKSYKSYFGNRTQWVFTAFAFLFSVSISIYCYNHLPLIDFRPYKIGTNISQSMVYPPNAEKDSVDIKLIYSKKGVEKEFTLQNYPKNDNTWVFVDQKSVVVKKGYEPPIHDFTIESIDNGEITNQVLANPSYTFLLISYDFKKANTSKSDQINKIYEFAKKNGYGFYAMTASVDEDIENYKKETKAEYPICLTDKITLKTIIRSNPGLVLIKNATVLNMWGINDLPKFNAPLEKSDLGQMQKPNTSKTMAIVIMFFLIPVLIIFGVDKLVNNRRD